MCSADLPHRAGARLCTARTRGLVINSHNTGETLKTEFFDGKKYNRDELARLNHLFRDYRAEQVKNIDPQLFDHLYRLQIMLGTSKPVQLISGYRTLATNNSLRKHGSGVATHRYPTLCQAIDFHIQGVDLANIRKAALKMRLGGVGYYPRSDFGHIGTGSASSWSWTRARNET